MAEQQLKRLLGRGFSIAACVGTIIGLGILRTPGEIALTISDPWIYIALWAGGGLFVLLSTLVAVELVAMTPRSGGPYVLIANAYGPYPGFLIGWTDWLANCASGALKAVVFMEYLALLHPELSHWITPGALLMTTLFASLQLGGVRLSGGVHQAASAIFAVILVSVTGSIAAGAADGPQSQAVAVQARELAQYGLVDSAIVFTYDGWITASYFGSEVNGGGRSLAIGSIKGVLLVIALYLALNSVLVFSVPLSELAGHELALAGALDLLHGPGAGNFIIFAALFILLAHMNLNYMTPTRALYALSVDDLGSRHATSVSGRGTPTGALLFSWLLTFCLILAGGFDALLSMASLFFIIMYVALMAGVIRLRRSRPDADRPFRAWAYPVSAWVCTLGWTAVALFIAAMDLRSAAYSLVLLLISIPAYLVLKQRRKS